ncbi:MAG: formate dehydrogenase accessory sulfurtransferase FdhD [Peptococcaceae bacterium]|nr:formate dehydrogenase accessory sulfurtransferase FdhD [Peptococcaceae bacterium]
MSLFSLVQTKKYCGERLEICRDEVVREFPVTVFVNDEELATLVCTPDSLEELAAGFLYGEGILSGPGDLKNIKVNHQDGLVWVETATPVPAAGNFLKRYITTCCGKGRASFYFVNDARGIKPLETEGFKITLENIRSLMAALEARAGLFRSTGGAHGAALCSPEGIIAFYEDVGRHNAVDKVAGHCFLKGIPLSDKAVALTGRVSSEILIKAARMGVPMIISRSAPTDLALQLAGELGVTVAGFVRGNRVNLYTHPERVITHGCD